MASSLDSFKKRILFISLVFFCLSLLLGGRLFSIQVLNSKIYKVFAQRQLNSYKLTPPIALRGDIYFQEKDGNLITAASVKTGFLVAVNPTLIDNPQKICEKIGRIVILDKEKCLKKTGKKNDPFEILVRHLNLKEAKAIERLHLKGLNIFEDEWRFNPGNNLASQVLGFVGYKGDELVGRYGLEQYYEDVLKGRKSKLKQSQSFAAIFHNLGNKIFGSNLHKGNDLVLTIEPRVQAVLENVLEDLKEKWQPKEAGGIILNPQTGEIIAMANKPDFNPNSYNQVKDFSVFRNPLVSDVFEMGSVFKPLTIAAALDLGKITPKTTYVDNGYVEIDGKKIENYDGKARGRVDIQRVLNESLNTGAVFVMRRLGREEFRNYMFKYGLAEKTGIDLPDERRGDLSNLNSPRELEYATASFGQGIAVTPIEFASAVSALANGGFLIRPYVVKKIIVNEGKNFINKTYIKRRVIKKKTSEEITRMLVKVVDQALLGGKARLKHYSIAAKTGTAQIPKKEGRGYYEGQYFHSFFGYGPAFDPRFLIFLYLNNPQGVKYSAYSLGPSFLELIRFLLNYYEVPPDR